MHTTLLAQRLRSARKTLYPPVPQREVARRFELSPSAVNLWEAGKTEPSAGHLVELAKWYGVSVDWLLGIETTLAKRKTDNQPIHVVPVLSAQALARWRFDAPVGALQSMVAYPHHTAADTQVSSDALMSVCPPGAFVIVVRKDHPTPGQIIMAQTGRASDPIVRRFVTEGRDALLVADDVRYPTYRMVQGVRIVGLVSEVCVRKLLT